MPIPVITIEQMRQWEQATWATGQTEAAVIGRVGELVARRALRLTGHNDLILILAGKGHNGDDARCAQPHLRNRQAEVLEVGDPAASLAPLAGLLAKHPALVIDGLFGIGLNRPLGPAWAELIELVNASGLPALAVDVPSGLNADTGEPLGAAIRAAVTLTLGAPKHGLLRPAAWPFVGRLEVAPDIGLASCACSSSLQWTLSSDFRSYPPRRPAGGHKGTFGHVAVFAGSLGYHGAAVLAARGAQRAQPGLVTLFTTTEVYVPVASQLQAVMVHRWTPGGRWPETVTALLYGPGLAAADLNADYKAEVAGWWQASLLPIVVDASALAWLPEGPTPPRALRLITPHPGEAARLLKSTSAAVQAERPAALRELSRRYGDCWVILKGYQTLVGRSQGNLYVNPSGNPALGQGGSGDVLGGYLAALLAQPALQAEPLQALRFAVWQHGAAADWLAAHKPNWTVEDLLEVLGEVKAG
jgi:NAD(P)H-hydrate epimerase